MAPLVGADSTTSQVVNLNVNMTLIKTGVTITVLNERLRHLVSERVSNLLSEVDSPDAGL